MPINRLVLFVTALSFTPLVACSSQPLTHSCACGAGPSDMQVCGTPLEASGGDFMILESNSPTPTGRDSPVRHSVIPAPMTFAAAVDRNLEVIRVLTGRGCKNDPVIVVNPLTAFRTVAVARGRNGGIAGITLAQLSDKVPTTVRAYRKGHFVGQIVINQPVPPPPPPSPSPPPTPTVRTVCLRQPMICFLKTFPPDPVG